MESLKVPLLGRFLEYSARSDDILGSLAFYTKLGFSQATVGDAWSYPYAVVTDGRIYIGLHQCLPENFMLTFVSPNLLRRADELESRGIALTLRQVSDLTFNQIAFNAPCGMAVRLIEARSFSPLARTADQESLCGYFEQVGLPMRDLDSAHAFWDQAGFVALEADDEDLPHVALVSDFINVGLFAAKTLRDPTLIFAADHLSERRGRLKSLSVEFEARLPGKLAASSASLIVAPEGTRLLLREGESGARS